jgi:peroxiredoxin Q/BCP
LRDDIERFRELGAQVVAVAPDTVDGVARYLARNPLPYPVVADPDHRVFDAYDVQSRLASLGQRPALFVVDRDGVVRYDAVGTQQWQIPTNDEVIAVLRSLAANP